jgi:hypothetical protein
MTPFGHLLAHAVVRKLLEECAAKPIRHGVAQAPHPLGVHAAGVAADLCDEWPLPRTAALLRRYADGQIRLSRGGSKYLWEDRWGKIAPKDVVGLNTNRSRLRNVQRPLSTCTQQRGPGKIAGGALGSIP